MIGMSFSRALTQTGFRHRATPVSGGRVNYRLADRSGHVVLSAYEWDAYGEVFEEQVRPVARKTFWLTIGLLPGLGLYMIVMGGILATALDSNFLASVAAVGFVVGLFFGPPGIYLWQSYRVKAIAAAIEKDLATFPRAAAPPAPVGRPPRWLEIAGLVLIGPGLVIAIIGQLGGPDTFRGTPLMGAHLTVVAIAGLAILAALLLYRVRARAEGRPASPEDEREGRRVNVVKRARGDIS